jgi:class 3 adenylate cyclase
MERSGAEPTMANAQADGVPIRRLNTVVFVDIVGSTGMAAELGDQRWAALLERFQTLVRRELADADGAEMDTAGDGFFTVFTDTVAAAVFGCSVSRAVESLGLRLRVGIHRGTCWVAGEKCSGVTVNIGARVVAAADPGEVLATAAVEKRLAGDARFDLHARGEADLKGVPGRWPLYSVTATSPVRARPGR